MRPKKLLGCTWAVVIFSILLDTCLTANWAQTSGNIQQNVVFPAMITPVHKHWQARFGHATVIAKDVSCWCLVYSDAERTHYFLCFD